MENLLKFSTVPFSKSEKLMIEARVRENAFKEGIYLGVAVWDENGFGITFETSTIYDQYFGWKDNGSDEWEFINPFTFIPEEIIPREIHWKSEEMGKLSDKNKPSI